MGRKTSTFNIPEFKMQQYQKQFSNFLKTYRYKHNLMAKDLAKKMGYTPQRYCQLESETIPQTRFASSLEFLSSIASLEGLSITEFVIFLEGEQDRLNKDGTLKRQLYKWEHILLKILDPVSRDLKDALVNEYSNQPLSKLEKMVKLCLIALKTKETVIDKLILLLEELETK